MKLQPGADSQSNKLLCCQLELRVDRSTRGGGGGVVGGRRTGQVRASDVEKADPGSADMEIVIVELGLYDHVPAARESNISMS